MSTFMMAVAAPRIKSFFAPVPRLCRHSRAAALQTKVPSGQRFRLVCTFLTRPLGLFELKAKKSAVLLFQYNFVTPSPSHFREKPYILAETKGYCLFRKQGNQSREGAHARFQRSAMSSGVETVQVFILAENRLLREALTRILNKKSDIHVVGASAFSPVVVQEIRSAAPDVLLSDSTAVALSELQLVSEARAVVPGLKVVMIGMDADQETFLRAVRDGVVGYVLKDASAMEVASAVRSVASGEAVCPPSLCAALFNKVSEQLTQPASFIIRHNLGLTRREQQLVQMIGRGLTNKEIAAQLNLSEQTIKNHIHRMLRKLGASDRLDAVEVCRMPGAVA
jgi:DNA-binding NarL/FixJ family response regulator